VAVDFFPTEQYRMSAPEIGICLPVTIAEETHKNGIYDGDTIRVHRLGSDLHLAVRLRDCWAPEVSIRGAARQYPQEQQAAIKQAGTAARDALVELTEQSPGDMRLFLGFDLIEGNDLLDLISLSRLLGWLWVGDTNVSEYLCSKGLAYPTKAELSAAGMC
jgi:hypothetical protein